MTENPTLTPTSDGKKSLSVKANENRKAVRDSNGRFLRGTAPGPGHPTLPPGFKALAVADRQKNFDFIRGLRDDSKADPWLRFEAAKLLAQYSDGKPLGTPLINVSNSVNIGGATPENPISMDAGEASRIYASVMSGVLPADSVRIEARPAREPVVLEAQPVEASE